MARVKVDGKKIGALRDSLFLSLEELSHRIGISKNHLWKIEHGEAVQLQPKTFRSLAAAVGMTPDELLARVGNPGVVLGLSSPPALVRRLAHEVRAKHLPPPRRHK